MSILALAAAALTIAQVAPARRASPAPVPAPAGTQPAPATATQPAAASQPASTQPATQPASTRPASTQPAGDEPPKPAEKISLNFKDAPLDAVLDYLSAAAGFVVVKEGTVEGRVTVMSKQPVTADEAVTLLSAVLKATGSPPSRTAACCGSSRATRRRRGASPSTSARTPRAISPTRRADHAGDPAPQHRRRRSCCTDLKPLLSPDADVTATAASNAIIITDTVVNIRRLAQIIAALDGQEASASDIRIVQLKYANAAAAAKLLSEVFKARAAAGGCRRSRCR